MDVMRPTENESKKRHIIVLLDNLFFRAKINEAAAATGVEAIYARNPEQAIERALREDPSLIIVDLNADTCFPFDLLERLKLEERLKAIPTLGFVAHVDLQLQERARRSGCDRVMARSVFDKSLVSLFSELSQSNREAT
jgi:CheY-like chemotaxis protein